MYSYTAEYVEQVFLAIVNLRLSLSSHLRLSALDVV